MLIYGASPEQVIRCRPLHVFYVASGRHVNQPVLVHLMLDHECGRSLVCHVLIRMRQNEDRRLMIHLLDLRLDLVLPLLIGLKPRSEEHLASIEVSPRSAERSSLLENHSHAVGDGERR